MPAFSHGQMKSEVAHHRGDDRVLSQLPGRLQRQRADREDLVTVDDLAVRIDGKAAVGIAVVGNAQIGALGHDVLGQLRRCGLSRRRR